MFQNQEKLRAEGRWPQLHAVVVFALLLLYTLILIWPSIIGNFFMYYVPALVYLLSALYFYRRGISGPVEFRLIICFTIWLFISRILNGDVFLLSNYGSVYSMLVVMMMLFTGYILSAGQREKLINWISFIIGGFFFCCALAGVFTTLTSSRINFPPDYTSIYLHDYYHYYSIDFLSIGHNTTALWFFIALGLMVYQFFNCKNRLWRIPIVLAALMHYLALTLSQCRAVEMSVAVASGMLALLLGLRYVRLNKKLVLVPLLCVITVLGMGLGYKGLSTSSVLINKVSAVTVPAFHEVYKNSSFKLHEDNFRLIEKGAQPVPQAAAGEQGYSLSPLRASSISDARIQQLSAEPLPADDVVDVVDRRDEMGFDFTFSERTTVWAAMVPAIKAEPSILWKGMLRQDVMPLVNSFTGILPRPHMHNYILEIFMLTGIPGLLLVLAFTVMLVWKMVKIFFGNQDMKLKVLTLIPAGVLVDGLMESFIFTLDDIRSLLFFLISGIILAYYYDDKALGNSTV